jgi:hypothetical protein
VCENLAFHRSEDLLRGVSGTEQKGTLLGALQTVNSRGLGKGHFMQWTQVLMAEQLRQLTYSRYLTRGPSDCEQRGLGQRHIRQRTEMTQSRALLLKNMGLNQ